MLGTGSNALYQAVSPSQPPYGHSALYFLFQWHRSFYFLYGKDN